MKENEAIEVLENHFKFLRESWKPYPDGKVLDALGIAISSMKEIQQYRTIGTVEECCAAVEKQRAKKPIMKTDDGIESISGLNPYCPSCGCELTDRIPFDNKDFYFHCLNCGQKLDWSDSP